MECCRCGKCCSFPVVIVHPDYISEYDPDETDINKVKQWVMIKEQGHHCPHLSWDGDIAICAIHHMEWFPETPCGRHGQVEDNPSRRCRTGKWNREKKLNVKEVYFET